MKQIAYLITAIILFSLFACAGDGAQKSNSNEQKTQMAPALPTVPIPIGQRLIDECDYIDILFYNYNFSVSLSDQTSIRQMLGIISDDTADHSPACASEGRMFFQSKGEIFLEADIHYQVDGCYYLVFLENGKPAYSNLMSPQGVNVFKQYMTQGIKQ